MVDLSLLSRMRSFLACWLGHVVEFRVASTTTIPCILQPSAIYVCMREKNYGRVREKSQ